MRDAFEADYGDDAATKTTARAQAKQARVMLDRLWQTRAAARAEQCAGSSEFTVKATYQDQAGTGPDASLPMVTEAGRCMSKKQVQGLLCALATTDPAFVEPHLLVPADASERRHMP